MVKHPPSVRLHARNHLDGAVLLALTALALRLQHFGHIPHATRRELEAVRRRAQIAAVRHGRHLQRRLGAVQERVEHLRVEVPGRELLVGEAVVIPDGVRGRVVVLGEVLGALSGAHNVEAGRARPVHHLGDERRLVSVRHRVDDAGLARLPGQERPRQDVGLDVDHDDVLLVLAAQQRVADTRRRVAGHLQDDIDLGGGDEGGRVGGDGRLAGLDAVGDGEGTRGVIPVLGEAGTL